MELDITQCDGSCILWCILFWSLCMLGYIWRKSHRETSNLPPGPPALPIVGSLPFLGKDFLKGLHHMHMKYGDVFTVAMPRPSVILNGHHAIKEAFVRHGDAFLGRPQDMLFATELTKGLGVVMSVGEFWQIQRRFTHKTLRQFGMGNDLLEASVKVEIHKLLNNLQKHENHPHNPMWDIMLTVSNVIASITYGKRHDHQDIQFHTFLKSITEDLASTGGPANLISLIPILRKVPGDVFGYQSYRKVVAYIKDFMKKQIRDHMQTFNPNQIRDLTDAFLVEMKKENLRENGHTTFHEEQLTSLLLDMFLAGSQTTTTVLRWAVVLMVYHQDVQIKIQQEVNEVVGNERLPCMADRNRMPYTEATLLEIQRFSTVVPLGLPHETTEDVTILGHDIPKGTQVFANIHSAHMDPKVWEDPEKFSPDRFVDAKGNVENREKMMSFSMGKRACLGESLARMELFLMFTSLLQRYTLSLSPGHPSPSLEPTFTGLLREPRDCQVILKARN